MKYETVKITEQIVAVVVKNNYDRAMLFCRAQEFYESPCGRFRGKKFSIWDYQKWYSDNGGHGCFSYTKDFEGFNFPMVVAKVCYELNERETPYDKIMSDIVDNYFVNGVKKYLIGVSSLNGTTFWHEMCHALYYTDMEYRNSMDEVTDGISKKNTTRLKKNLKDMGYCGRVFKDEVQAYMSTEINQKLTRGVSGLKDLHASYRPIFKKFKPII
jgi:hypothetical protein